MYSVDMHPKSSIRSAFQDSFQLDDDVIMGRKELLFLREGSDVALEKLDWLWRTEAILRGRILF